MNNVPQIDNPQDPRTWSKPTPETASGPQNWEKPTPEKATTGSQEKLALPSRKAPVAAQPEKFKVDLGRIY